MKEPESSSNPWATVTLGDLSEVKSGVGFPKKYQGQSSGDYPVYKVGDVSRAVTLRQGLLNSANHYVTTEEAGTLKGVIFRTGSTLFAKIGEAVKLNRRAFVMRPGLADNNVMAVVPLLNESDRYLHYFLRTVDLSDVSRSTTVPSVRKGDIEDLIIPLPPLDEQKVIAEKLDTLLAQVENTKARLERIPQILKRFRQSVLAAAVSGRLTEEWDDRNGSTSSKNLCIDDIAQLVTKGASPKWQGISYVQDTSQTMFVTSENVGNMCLLLESPKYVQDSFNKKQSRSMLREGDVLTNIVGASIGRSAVWNKALRANINQAVCLIRVDPNQCVAKYLCYYLNSPDGISQLVGNKVDVARANVSLGNVKGVTLNLPSIEDQTEIVRRVDQLFAHADRIEQQVNNALARVNNLTQSILAKAFRGELTEQWRKDNPELVSGDNSAEALLDRIKAERAAQQPIKKTRAGKASH